MNHLATLPGTRSDTSPAHAPSAPPRAARLAALGAVAGPILFTVAWIVLGFLSPGTPSMAPGSRPTHRSANPSAGLAWGSLPRT